MDFCCYSWHIFCIDNFRNILKTFKKIIINDITKNFGIQVHKNSDALMILNVCDFIFVCWQNTYSAISWGFRGGLDFFDLRSGQFGSQKGVRPLKKSLEIADYVFCTHKKITSLTVRIIDVLIVIIHVLELNLTTFNGLATKLFKSLHPNEQPSKDIHTLLWRQCAAVRTTSCWMRVPPHRKWGGPSPVANKMAAIHGNSP